MCPKSVSILYPGESFARFAGRILYEDTKRGPFPYMNEVMSW